VTTQQPKVRTGLGTAVRELRREHRLSRGELAHRTHLHPGYLAGIERGQRNPTWDVLSALADAFGIRVSELAARAEAVEDLRHDVA
jgi:transcriptional regulator with XRE-family HTH domain